MRITAEGSSNPGLRQPTFDRPHSRLPHRLTTNLISLSISCSCSLRILQGLELYELRGPATSTCNNSGKSPQDTSRTMWLFDETTCWRRREQSDRHRASLVVRPVALFSSTLLRLPLTAALESRLAPRWSTCMCLHTCRLNQSQQRVGQDDDHRVTLAVRHRPAGQVGLVVRPVDLFLQIWMAFGSTVACSSCEVSHPRKP